jgi:hypothetical protein
MSSPSPSSDGQSLALEHELTDIFPLQSASSQGIPSSAQVGSSSVCTWSLPLGTVIEAADEDMEETPGAQMMQPMEVDPQSAMNEELTRTL